MANEDDYKLIYVGGMAIQCRKGWLEIVTNCYDELLKIDPDFTVAQIKEKFGTLRFYFDTRTELWDEMQAVVTKYEHMSAVTCEVCGAPGECGKQKGYWIRTTCEAHR